ncbi:hypothetical protein K466DRAFT_597265 [Polyporus arcularius HHB13444]|uniref:F-box domain-containing protein n=1 Tax=Polyporus arcularius HHB13444 TaxID=1314778 RepID=A0A5C3PM60_9APHY|nr:hypothetical protein K466DRAFT_597265 [Polyporus arcularius HHB13444]
MPLKKKSKNSRTSAPATSAGSASTKTVIYRHRSATRSSRVHGSCGGLEDMPLDVLFEIFRLLHPRDLLSLARTTKDFRALLMSRSSASCWATSRKQIQGLPEIPENLSEPAYANLMFCNHCHRCLKTGTHVSAYWDILARYCTVCRDVMITSKISTSAILVELKGMAEACGLTYDNDIAIPIYVRSSERYGYYLPELEDVKNAFKALKTKKDKIKYIREREALVSLRQDNALKLTAWEEVLEQNAIAEEAALVAERRAAIWAKLRDEGWGEDIDWMSSADRENLSDLKVACRPSKLTDRSWSLSRAAVIGFMKKVRVRRLKEQQVALFATRFIWLATALCEYQHQKWLEDRQGYVFVPFADCVTDKEIRTVIEDTPADFTEEAVKAKLNDLVPTVVSRWVDGRRAEFTTLLLRELGQDSLAAGAADPLALAIAWFGCTSGWSYGGCSCNARWPRILDHLHFRREYLLAGDTFAAAFRSSQKSWQVKYDGQRCCADKRLAHVRDVITACGADPDTATYAQMEESNPRLVCRICATLLKREVFDWKAAVSHDFEKHDSRLVVSKPLARRWERIPDELAAVAKTVEDVLLTKTTAYTSFRCAWCAKDGLPDTMMKAHIQSCHGKASPQLDEDFFVFNMDRTSIWMFSDILSESPAEKAAVQAGTAFFAPL